MASLKAAMKGHQKTHRERGQISGRKHMGLLEKKKDYILRAKDFHRKEKTIKRLKQKALEKNPDEFYFQMINSRTNDGVHIKEHNNKKYTNDQLKLMKTQDINYVNLKKNTEQKKIEKLQANLHFTDLADEQKRNHVFFVDTQEEMESFDLSKRMNTIPEFVGRSHNIPTVDMLSQYDFTLADDFLVRKKKKFAYKELEQRIERDKMLNEIREEMTLKRRLAGKGTVHKKKNKDGGSTYRWKKIRKR